MTWLLVALCAVNQVVQAEDVKPAVLTKSETLMTGCMQIEPTTCTGLIRINAGEDNSRTYTWEGASRSVKMLPRSERWYGSLGLYYPGPGEHWKEHNGITRGVLEEGKQHFKTEAEAMQWIQNRRKWLPLVYNDGGLLVGWRKFPRRRQVNVEVWQITVAGRKPAKLPGSKNASIKVMTP